MQCQQMYLHRVLVIKARQTDFTLVRFHVGVDRLPVLVKFIACWKLLAANATRVLGNAVLLGSLQRLVFGDDLRFRLVRCTSFGAVQAGSF